MVDFCLFFVLLFIFHNVYLFYKQRVSPLWNNKKIEVGLETGVEIQKRLPWFPVYTSTSINLRASGIRD